MNLRMGRYDDPSNQIQPEFLINPHETNIAVFGLPDTGKTTFVKTFLVNIIENNQLPKEYIYILDFGGNLGDYSELDNICACFNDSNEENIKRVFKELEKRISENATSLNSKNYRDVASTNPDSCPPHYILIIENINSFLSDDRYQSYYDLFFSFCRDGLSKGLSVLFTANDTTGTGKLLSYFKQKISFEMPELSSIDIFGIRAPSVLKAKGRGVINLNGKLFEFQCFLPFSNNEKEWLHRHSSFGDNPKKLIAFPPILTNDSLSTFSATNQFEKDDIIVGLDYYDHLPIAVDITDSHSVAIYGKRHFGKTNLLSVLLQGLFHKLVNNPFRFVYFDDGRKQLEELYNYYVKKKVDSIYLTSVNDFQDYLTENGYGGERRHELAHKLFEQDKAAGLIPIHCSQMPPRYTQTEPSLDTPFTVFIIQSKLFYQSVNLYKTQLAKMMNEANTYHYFFVFSDVQQLSDVSNYVYFNSYIDIAFLLDNISDFVMEKGSRSVFNSFDTKELKYEYAKCSLGDGYYYDVQSDILKKVKFIKANAGDS